MTSALRGTLAFSWSSGVRRMLPSLNNTSSASTLPSRLVSSRGVASRLFVGGLSFFTSDDFLAEAFSKFGQVIEARVVTDRVSDKSKGFGFVTFASEDEAHDALEQMNGKVLNGRVIYVDVAKAKQQQPFFAYPVARGPPEPPITE